MHQFRALEMKSHILAKQTSCTSYNYWRGPFFSFGFNTVPCGFFFHLVKVDLIEFCNQIARIQNRQSWFAATKNGIICFVSFLLLFVLLLVAVRICRSSKEVRCIPWHISVVLPRLSVYVYFWNRSYRITSTINLPLIEETLDFKIILIFKITKFAFHFMGHLPWSPLKFCFRKVHPESGRNNNHLSSLTYIVLKFAPIMPQNELDTYTKQKIKSAFCCSRRFPREREPLHEMDNVILCFINMFKMFIGIDRLACAIYT